MKNAKFSPMYWKVRHHALIDLQRQIGYPKLFFTIAPYEWSFPYHDWVLDEMAKALQSRLNLPAAETLHIAQVFKEVVRGLLTGWNQKNNNDNAKRERGDRTWSKHLLRCRDGSEKETVSGFFGRFEYQDGKRKEGTQQYHGRGSIHLHCLIWLDDVQAIKLEEVMSASVPENEPLLAAYVKGNATTAGKSSCAVNEEPSGWNEFADSFRLHHTEEDYCDGRRAYFMDIMDALKCHQDVQITDSDREGTGQCKEVVGLITCECARLSRMSERKLLHSCCFSGFAKMK